jgi:nicotinamide-nucleotide amidase
LGESNISELIGDWPFPEVKLAYLPKYGCVDLRLDALSDSTDKTERLLDEAEQFLLQKISPFVYARGEVELASVVGERLRRNHWRLAVAESCTGGLLASIITDIPGASDYFDCGFITYSNQAKTDMLDLPQEIIQKHGAVSPEAARLMAEGAKKRAGADFALSITGIAGPSGGTPEKPVGTVFIGIATPEDTEVRKFNFRDDRVMNRKRAAFAALILLFQTLKDFSSKNG